MGYTKDALKGVSWLGTFRILTRVISFLRTIVIARLLTPSQFGVYGIAALVLSFIEILTETGINIFLTQRKDEIDKYINTAWVVSIARGLLISLVIAVGAVPVANFFNSQDAVPLILLISTVPFIRGFINPSIVKFLKDLQYRTEFTYRLLVFIVESVISIGTVLILQSPIGLVWGLVAGALFEVVLSFYLASPRPRFEFKTELFRNIVSTGKWMTASGIFNYLYHNIDNVFVGRLLGVSSLGLYDMAYRISMLPISEGSDLIGKVTFPVYVKIADDVKRLRRAYLRSVFAISVLVIPLGAIIFMFPEFVISVLLGSQWVEASGVLRILVLFGIVRAISFSSIAPFYALEKQKYVTIVTFVSVVGMVITVIPFITMFGLVGAGYSALFGSILALPVIVYYLYKILR